MFRSRRMKKKALKLMRENIKRDGVNVTELACDNTKEVIAYIHGQYHRAKEQIKTQYKF
jgi:hypothetical protein